MRHLLSEDDNRPIDQLVADFDRLQCSIRRVREDVLNSLEWMNEDEMK
jgi:hypothetical protein